MKNLIRIDNFEYVLDETGFYVLLKNYIQKHKHMRMDRVLAEKSK